MENSKKISILCVDDERIPLLLRTRVLEWAGFEVVGATSANEALDAMHGRHFDLVLSDQLMPGMTGTQLARVIRQSHPKVPFILVSGINEVPEGIESVDLFISKLDGPVALCESITNILIERKRMPASHAAGTVL